MELPRNESGWMPGTWRHWIFGPRRVAGAVVVCPSCGHGMSVGGGRLFGSVHTIAPNGAVSPSLVCRWCAWHVFVQLEGWDRACLPG